MKKIKDILLCLIIILGLIAVYISIKGLNCALDHISYLDKGIDDNNLYTIIISNRPLVGFLKDFYVNVSIYRDIITCLFLGMVVLISVYGYCLYRSIRNKRRAKG